MCSSLYFQNFKRSNTEYAYLNMITISGCLGHMWKLDIVTIDYASVPPPKYIVEMLVIVRHSRIQGLHVVL
jgi:hypothetical protein